MDFSWITNSLEKLGLFYQYLAIDLADPRTVIWPLMGDPTWVFILIWSYITFVTKVGPAIMKDRKPFDLKNILIVYNFIQVLISLYIMLHTIYFGYIVGGYSFKCQMVERTRSYSAYWIARGCYFYFLAKCTELLETVFFVMRKKFKQISFLHVFHHSSMVLISHALTKWFPGGNIIFYGLLNTFVHTVMYMYYLISAMGPEYRKYLWWKKYITVIQLVQFLLSFLHASQLFFVDCGFPKWILWIVLPNAFGFYFLFYDFYKKAYKIQQEHNEQQKNSNISKNMNDKNNNNNNNSKSQDNVAPPDLRKAATSIVDADLGHFYTFGTFMLVLFLISYPRDNKIAV